MSGITISKITEVDIEGFRNALDVVCKEKKFMAFTEAPPLEKSIAFVKSNIAGHYPQFVAKQNGQVVGWCDILPNTSRDTRRHIGTAGIGLLPQARGQGLGRKLMQTAIAAAKEFGLTRIELTVRDTNENAIALYKSLGFEIEGLLKNDLKIDGVYHSSYTMALLLDDK